MIPPLYKTKQTVFFLFNDTIQSGEILAIGKDKEQFTGKEKNKIGQILTNNIYFIKGFPGKQFKESELSDSPERFL